MEWIEVNLPWKINISLDFPEFPISVQKKVKAKFGKDFDEMANEFAKNFGEEFWEVRDNYRFKIDRNYYLGDNEFYAKMQKSKDSAVKASAELINKRDIIDEFRSNLPEVIAWGVECDNVKKQGDDLEANGCFRRSPLNRPGVLIEVKYNDGILSKFLIGDCFDGEGFLYCDNPFVTRAMVLISKEDLDAIK